MGTIQDAQLALQLGTIYQTAATNIGSFLVNSMDTLSKANYDLISDDQSRIISYANTFLSLADNIAFEGSGPYFDQIRAATGQINAAITHFDQVNKIISISAGVITLAASILSANGSGIVSSLASIAEGF